MTLIEQIKENQKRPMSYDMNTRLISQSLSIEELEEVVAMKGTDASVQSLRVIAQRRIEVIKSSELYKQATLNKSKK